MGSGILSIDLVHRVVEKEVIQHPPRLVAARRIRLPSSEQRERHHVLSNISWRVILPLPLGGCHPDPFTDVGPRLRRILLGRPAIEPVRRRAIRPQLRHHAQTRVVHQPVVLGVTAARPISPPKVTETLLVRDRQAPLPGRHEHDHLVHPEHVSGRRSRQQLRKADVRRLQVDP